MNIWTAAVVIVAIVAFSRVLRSRHMHKSSTSDEVFDDISQRMSRLEERMANIETIGLDKKKKKSLQTSKHTFDKLMRNQYSDIT